MAFDPNNPNDVKAFRSRMSVSFERDIKDLRNVKALVKDVGSTKKGQDFIKQELGARAFAVGSSVDFGSDRDAGVVAHELAHVVQQRQGRR